MPRRHWRPMVKIAEGKDEPNKKPHPIRRRARALAIVCVHSNIISSDVCTLLGPVSGLTSNKNATPNGPLPDVAIVCLLSEVI